MRVRPSRCGCRRLERKRRRAKSLPILRANRKTLTAKRLDFEQDLRHCLDHCAPQTQRFKSLRVNLLEMRIQAPTRHGPITDSLGSLVTWPWVGTDAFHRCGLVLGRPPWREMRSAPVLAALALAPRRSVRLHHTTSPVATRLWKTAQDKPKPGAQGSGAVHRSHIAWPSRYWLSRWPCLLHILKC